jgi:predicted RNA binding protein YcfA (HicA-like mRNA interferase family)
LGYRIGRSRGSHRILEAPGRPSVLFAFHMSRTVPGWMVRRVLTRQVGLTDAEAHDIVRKG